MSIGIIVPCVAGLNTYRFIGIDGETARSAHAATLPDSNQLDKPMHIN